MNNRGVARGGAEGARAPPEFGRSVNPIQTRGADYAPHTTASPPGFKNISTSLCTLYLYALAKYGLKTLIDLHIDPRLATISKEVS